MPRRTWSLPHLQMIDPKLTSKLPLQNVDTINFSLTFTTTTNMGQATSRTFHTWCLAVTDASQILYRCYAPSINRHSLSLLA
jgi:hypothetical protein